MPRALALGLGAALVLSPAAVLAHDLPRGLALAFPDDSDALPIVLTNRGLIFANPEASGGRFALRCSEAYGATVAERPHLVASASGLLVVTPLGAEWTQDGACTFSTAPEPSGAYLGGFAATAGDERLLLSTLAPDAESYLLESTNGGQSWTTKSTNRANEVFTALAIAPSDAQRVYAAGTRVDRKAQTVTSLWASSSDGGAHFTVTDVLRERTPLAVHPTNPALVFAYQLTDEVETSYRLLRSEDSGASFVSVHDALSSVTSFAATDGGSALWMGVGREGGLFRSDDAGIIFTRVHEEFQEVHCLHERRGELWLCGNKLPNVDGVWKSSDGGATFDPVLTFPEVTEPVACGDGATAICAAAWRDWELELLPPVISDGGVPADGSVVPLPGHDAGVPPDPVTGDAGPEPSKKSGHCQALPWVHAGGALPALFVTVLVGMARRRWRRA